MQQISVPYVLTSNYSLVTGLYYILWIDVTPYMFLLVFRSTDVSLVNKRYVHLCIRNYMDQFLYWNMWKPQRIIEFIAVHFQRILNEDVSGW